MGSWDDIDAWAERAGNGQGRRRAPQPLEPLPNGMSRDRARTQRANARIERGIHPTGVALLEPRGQTCGDCLHLRTKQATKRYFKCELVGDTSGPATDIRKSWAACEKFEELAAPDIDISPKNRELASMLAASTDQNAHLIMQDLCAEFGMGRHRFWMDRERQIARALWLCSYTPSSFEKRFARDISVRAAVSASTITLRQADWLKQQAYRYREQLGEHGIPLEWVDLAVSP